MFHKIKLVRFFAHPVVAEVDWTTETAMLMAEMFYQRSYATVNPPSYKCTVQTTEWPVNQLNLQKLF